MSMGRRDRGGRKAAGLLREAGLRRTRGREGVLRVLLGAGKALSEGEIGARLRGEGRVDKVTVYRVLGRLEAAGLVHRAYVRGRRWHFELAEGGGSGGCHPHFSCVGCGQTYCLLEARAGVVEGLAAGFVVRRQRVRLEGYCPRCSGG